MVRGILPILLALFTLPIFSCKNPECSIADAEARGAIKKRVTGQSVTINRVQNQWVPTEVLRYERYQKPGHNKVTLGVSELMDGRTAIPEFSTLSETPSLLMLKLLQSIDGSMDAKELEELASQFEFSMEIPPLPQNATTSDGQINQDIRWLPLGGLSSGSSMSWFSGDERLSWFDQVDLSLKGVKVRDLRAPIGVLNQFHSKEGFSSNLPFEVLHYSGHPQNRLNLIILGDGYQEHELAGYGMQAKTITAELFGQQPYKDFENFFNVIRVDVASQESGADCDDRKYSPRKNRYGSTFPVACVNARMGTKFADRFLYQTKLAKVRQDSLSITFDGVSVVDEVLVLVNTKKFGAAGIFWATQSRTAGAKTAAHELGHTIGGLADEYVLKSDLCHIYMAMRPNLSIKRSRSKVKWSHWILKDTPLPTPEQAEYAGLVGLFQGGGGGCQNVLYRPTSSCKMDNHYREFCPVCMEQMVLRLYDYVSPIDGSLKKSDDAVTASVINGNRFKTRWYADDRILQETHGYQDLKGYSGDLQKVRLVLFDEQAPVRKDKCHLVFSSQI